MGGYSPVAARRAQESGQAGHKGWGRNAACRCAAREAQPLGKGRYALWLRLNSRQAGEFINLDPSPDTDEAALAANYVSIVPCRFDLTHYAALDTLSQTWALPLTAAAAAGPIPQPIASQDYGPAQ